MSQSSDSRMFLTQSGNIEVYLTTCPEKIREAQKLRYRVFSDHYHHSHHFEHAQNEGIDEDVLDKFCHILIAEDVRDGRVVGTYRLIQEDAAHKAGGFLSSSEFDLKILEKQPWRKLELGRACVDPEYRTGRTIHLLWQVIKAYIVHFDISLLFGIGSFPVVQAEAVKQALSYLHAYYLAPEHYRTRALASSFVSMDIIPKDHIDVTQALAELPPLIKGYIRIGGFVGEGAFLDTSFGSLDVCIVGEAQKMVQNFSALFHNGKKAEEEIL